MEMEMEMGKAMGVAGRTGEKKKRARQLERERVSEGREVGGELHGMGTEKKKVWGKGRIREWGRGRGGMME